MPYITSRVVTVIGGGGFIGRELVTRLLATGYVVRVASRRPEALDALLRIPGRGRVELLRASVMDEDSLVRAFDGAEEGVNLVSIMDPDLNRLRKINVRGAENAARAALRSGVSRYVHVSAIGASLTSPGAYGRSKGEAEYAVKGAFGGASLIRPSVVFGPEDSFLNMFALIAKLSPVLPVFAGRTRYQPVYVGDVADAIIALLTQERAGWTVEAGGPDILTMRALMAFVLEATQRRRLLLPVPDAVARLEGMLFERLPGHILTSDQVAMMRVDNIVQPGARTLADLGIEASSLRVIARRYLGGSIRDSWERFFAR